METHRLILTVFVFSAIIGTLVFSEPSITGFVPSELYSQSLDIDVLESQRFTLTSGDASALDLTSFLLSGVVEGPGLVNVYLSDGKSRWLVFSNRKKEGSSSMAHITGMAVADLDIIPGEKLKVIESLPKGYIAESGVFNHGCMETCVMAEGLITKAHLYLDVIIEPGTALHISEFSFSISS